MIKVAPYTLLCCVFALSLKFSFYLLRQTCRIRVYGEPEHHSGTIEAIWHQDLPLYFICCPFSKNKPHMWLQHSAWYMKTVHLFLQFSGVQFALGSSGNNGQRALKTVINKLRTGFSTLVTPDGPKGPAKNLKTGVIQMAIETNLPIQVIHFRCSSIVHLPTWDKKVVPLPFSSIDVHYAKKITADEDVEKMTRQVQALLNNESAI